MRAFSQKSTERLMTCRLSLESVVRRALEICAVDFGVTEGVRSLERQKFLFKTGASDTLNSKHLPDKDGKSRAVDLAPYLDTDGDGDQEFSWHWAHCFIVAEAMRRAAKELGVKVVWGGCWDRALNSLEGPLQSAMDGYAARRRTQGDRHPFVDGPHFQLATGQE